MFKKLERRDPKQIEAIDKKIKQILEDPFHFKPLRFPMQNLRAVHTIDPFVLVYEIDENKKVIIIRSYGHHDEVYKKR
jgi:mRNA interferase RelE/StbE/toxin YoeB